MKIISYQAIKNTEPNFKNKNKTHSSFRLRQLSKDVFQKSTPSTEKCEKTNTNLSEKELNRIYDEVFEEVLRETPVLKKINAQKPKLFFKRIKHSKKNPLEVLANYNVYTNTICMSSDFKKNAYAFEAFNENGECVLADIIFKLPLKKKTMTTQDGEKLNCKYTKLTAEEKRMLIKSSLIHELRHWMQYQLLFSTSGCEKTYEELTAPIKELRELLNTAITINKDSQKQKENRKLEKILKTNDKEYTYILNCEHTPVLSEDFKIKASMLPNENKYWSIKEHFLPASLDYNTSDNEKYESNAIEIDAYFYQSNYLVQNYSANPNIRENVFLAMLVPKIARGELVIEKLEEFGYPPLYEIN